MTPFLPAVSTFPPCPLCRSTAQPLRIIYGLPTLDLAMDERTGGYVLGGCVIGPESPDYECRDCGAALPGSPATVTGSSASPSHPARPRL